jgi:hypothetical protein
LPALHDPVHHEGEEAGISSTTDTVAPMVKFCWPETWL